MPTLPAVPESARGGLLPRLVAWLDSQSRTQLLASAAIMVAGLAGLSSAVGSDLVLVVFYLAPIGVSAYFVGRREGRSIALLSALSWTVMAEALSPASTVLPIVLAAGVNRAVLFLVVAELLGSLRTAFEHERELARTDSLTGIANARSFTEVATSELLRSRRYGRPLTVVYLDLDGFKEVNDRMGHAAGDVVLKRVAAACRDTLRRTDLVARLGGDEFAALLPETGAEAAQLVIGKLQRVLSTAFASEGWTVTASFGVVTCAVAPDAVDAVLDRADRLTYRSKSNGPNQVTHETVSSWGQQQPI
ncbi:MAG TPA: GGDEF domain-containing protein [Gemmatimonadales bacterium]